MEKKTYAVSVDTVYTDDGQPPLSAIAAYLQALQTTYVNSNVAVRAGIRQLTVSSLSDIETLVKRHHIHSFMVSCVFYYAKQLLKFDWIKRISEACNSQSIARIISHVGATVGLI